ncbi:MAG TPA: sigma-54 dependent transcriptional regulator [Candidatus Acidoferrales bacterium]|nr:sigma-54 dependent transcriptional regulator [Candidatus Acidoferrales bacterium]
MPKPAILVVDDESEIRESLELLLASEGYDVGLADSVESALARLGEHPFDLLLLDVSLPDRSGIDLLKEIRGRDPSLPIILITAFGSIDMAREAFKNGAQDYITKPWSNDELLAQIAQAIESRRLREENVQLKRAFKQRYNFPNIVGKSEKMLALLDLVRQVAGSRSTVLIYGESGTGKELIAKAIHAASPRAERPFVPINTGSMPVDLLESLLFGHVRGAFTGAVAPKKGLFEVADQGTLFLDEISTIGPETQAKLLRVIQEREFMRLGGTETIKTDVRILAASNADLAAMVHEGGFREDLYHRLNVIALRLPALRERIEDVPLLVEHFLERYSQENRKPLRRFSPAAMRLLVDYDWPGNVRELENVVERAVVLSSGETLGPDLLPESVLTREIIEGLRLPVSSFAREPSGDGGAPASRAGQGGRASAAGLFGILEEVERRLIVDMLDRTSGNQTEAAERFRIPLSTLNQKIKRLGIDPRRRGRSGSPPSSEPPPDPAPASAKTAVT